MSGHYYLCTAGSLFYSRISLFSHPPATFGVDTAFDSAGSLCNRVRSKFSIFPLPKGHHEGMPFRCGFDSQFLISAINDHTSLIPGRR